MSNNALRAWFDLTQQNILVYKLTPNKKKNSIIWVYKLKPTIDWIKYMDKVCLIVCEFEQKEGVNFHETFAQVVQWSTICSVLWHLQHIMRGKCFTLIWKLCFWMDLLLMKCTWHNLKERSFGLQINGHSLAFVKILEHGMAKLTLAWKMFKI